MKLARIGVKEGHTVAMLGAVVLAMALVGCPPGQDVDGDGFSPPADLDDTDPLTYPGAPELADIKDNNCNGFEDEPPVGFTRVGSTLQGAASAVEWYGDYVYLAAAAVLQTYFAPPGAEPVLVGEMEFRDWIREMVRDGDTLFLAARGDGLHALDLTDPANPRRAGSVTGVFDALGYTDIEAVFVGVDARVDVVAVARFHHVWRSLGGVDAVVFAYDPGAESFTPVRVLDAAETRANTAMEGPTTVALTEDGTGLYVGLGYFGPAVSIPPLDVRGELAYIPLSGAAKTALYLPDIGMASDIETVGHTAFVAVSEADATEPCSILSRVELVDGALEEHVILSESGSSAGGSLDVHNGYLCVGLHTIHRFEGNNLWTFTDIMSDAPTMVGAANTLDWIYQVACRSDGTGQHVYVADEWGGLEVWAQDAGGLTLAERVPTGALSPKVWSDGSTVYSAKRGAALWSFDIADPSDEHVAVEWIDPDSPGCTRPGGACPIDGPYPPAVFVGGGTVNQGRVATIGGDRSDMVGLAHAYFMVFEQDAEHTCVYSEHINNPLGPGDVDAAGEILFVTAGQAGLRVYQHCPSQPDDVRFLASAPAPLTALFIDAAAYGDYVFVAETNMLVDVGSIRVYRYKEGDLPTCPDQPVITLEYLGSFATDLVPATLLADEDHGMLIVGCKTKVARPGGLFIFPLPAPGEDIAVDGLDAARVNVSPGPLSRIMFTSVAGLHRNGDDLYVADERNGLYRYALDTGEYTGYFPAHPSGIAQAMLVRSAEGVVPLCGPSSVATPEPGTVVVQEFVTGRVAILAE